MTKDEALKLALEALEALEADPLEMVADVDGHMVFLKDKAITAIKEALAQPKQDGQCKRCIDGCPACDARKLPQQEPVAWEQFHEHMAGPNYVAPQQGPVAWGVFEGNLHDMFFTEAEAVEMAQLKGTHAEVKPLYTAPQRKPLTDEDVERIVREARVGEHGIGYTIARAIEAAHGIKE